MGKAVESLCGLDLAGGWTVVHRVGRDDTRSGGSYSAQYVIRRSDGAEAFLKAIDYEEAMAADDRVTALQNLTASYNFERRLHEACVGKRLSRVVIALGHGKVNTTSGPVDYLLFELADTDVRGRTVAFPSFDPEWSLRALHQVAVGLRQLHSNRIAHQDLKPSNILVFGQELTKLCDLGRSAWVGEIPPHETETIPGDMTYAPPEQLYGAISSDWECRRLGADLYLLGSMIMFFFVGCPMTPALFSEIPEAMWWDKWQGTYADVLPVVRDAFGRALRHFDDSVDARWREKLTRIVGELCEPDPTKRGYSRGRHINSMESRYDLQRYISEFDLMLRHAKFTRRSSNS